MLLIGIILILPLTILLLRQMLRIIRGFPVEDLVLISFIFMAFLGLFFIAKAADKYALGAIHFSHGHHGKRNR